MAKTRRTNTALLLPVLTRTDKAGLLQGERMEGSKDKQVLS